MHCSSLFCGSVLHGAMCFQTVIGWTNSRLARRKSRWCTNSFLGCFHCSYYSHVLSLNTSDTHTEHILWALLSSPVFNLILVKAATCPTIRQFMATQTIIFAIISIHTFDYTMLVCRPFPGAGKKFTSINSFRIQFKTFGYHE